ncbi:response regulator transcription factor [Hymenobacter aquaticus]|uniref:Response regulator transcription factor n=1 Tax=Hymenobacter aquaticus TaxID=1867101 RepID=A0A4Z0PSU0_9BACT|nr:response regulator transcription factor [Hymenobacter aquaticus]TGE20535.1 response regulator transcription factor [Hymenobacter aquaticus]
MYSPPGAVLIIAPSTLYRYGLELTLQQAWPALDLMLTADACQAPALLRRHAYRLVVVDGLLPDPPLPQLLELLRLARPAQPVLLLAGQRQPAALRHLLSTQLPAVALVPRHAAPEAILLATAQLLDTTPALARLDEACLATRRLPHSGPATPFSRRELEVLRLVVADHCNQEIADQLCLSVRTVESHRRALLQKAGARTLLGLAVQAVREGWIAA